MKVVTTALLAVAVAIQAASANTIVDDSTCVWKTSAFSCQPKALCSYQYRFGDLTLSESCRVKDGVNYYPQQIHLAFAGETTGTGMTVSWATFEEVSDSTLWVGDSEDSLEAVDTTVSSVSYYSDDTYDLHHHHATISGLSPNTIYYYKVGSSSQTTYQSDVATFKTARSADDDSTFNMIIYGDVGDGDNSADTIEYMNTLGTNDIDLVYHLGDVSYADDDYLVASQITGFFYEEVYNKWMNSLMDLMTQVPYMVLPGNHEAECHSPACQLSQSKKDQLGNYTAYNARFKMPSDESDGTLNMWYSFDHGPIHFTTLSSETDYTDAPTNEATLTNKNGDFGDQLTWLEADLKKAVANRASVPWIFVGMHRPMYITAFSSSSGVPNDDQTLAIQSAFEALFIKYEVDVVLAGHKHYYERQLPIANNKAVTTGVSNDNKTYTNPAAPVYILSGAGGNVEDIADAPTYTVPWNVASDYESFGFNTLAVNKTTLSWKFLESNDLSVVDEFVMIKN